MTYAIALAVIAGPTIARAELQIDGSREAVVLQAKQAPLSEVLDALAGKFDVRVRTSIPPEGRVDGNFAGPLASVVARLLSAYNYVLAPGRTDGRRTLEIILISKKTSAQAGAATLPRPGPETPAAQWRKLPIKDGR